MLNVNLLAADCSTVRWKITGSGLYSNNNVSYHFNVENHDYGKLLIAEMPVKSPKLVEREETPPVLLSWRERRPRIVTSPYGWRKEIPIKPTLPTGWSKGMQRAVTSQYGRTERIHHHMTSPDDWRKERPCNVTSHIGSRKHKPGSRFVTVSATDTERGMYIFNTSKILINTRPQLSYLPLRHNTGYLEVCKRNVCCQVEYEFNFHSPDELFVLSICDDVFHNEIDDMYLEICAVQICRTNNISSCRDAVLTSRSTFSRFTLTARLQTTHVIPFVTTVKPTGYDLAFGEYRYLKDGRTHTLHSETGFKHPMLVCALFGRHYTRDL
jgi:hypothetical protein